MPAIDTRVSAPTVSPPSAAREPAHGKLYRVRAAAGPCRQSDRSASSAFLIESIKKDLATRHATGVPVGHRIRLVHATLGIPAAWLADRTNRRNFVALSRALWSGMTAACGAAQSFVQLGLARVGVAVGESGAGPASVSMISRCIRANGVDAPCRWLRVGL